MKTKSLQHYGLSLLTAGATLYGVTAVSEVLAGRRFVSPTIAMPGHHF